MCQTAWLINSLLDEDGLVKQDSYKFYLHAVSRCVDVKLKGCLLDRNLPGSTYNNFVLFTTSLFTVIPNEDTYSCDGVKLLLKLYIEFEFTNKWMLIETRMYNLYSGENIISFFRNVVKNTISATWKLKMNSAVLHWKNQYLLENKCSFINYRLMISVKFAYYCGYDANLLKAYFSWNLHTCLDSIYICNIVLLDFVNAILYE